MVIAAVPEGMLPKAWWIFQNNIPLLWYGIKITLMLAVLGTFFGLLIGLVLGGVRAVKIEPRDRMPIRIVKRILHSTVAVYVWFFRGTPMMVQAMFLYYALRPYLGWSANVAGVVIISVNTGAYMSEIIRAGIQSIDKGQIEAARSLGMTNTQTMTAIVLPQAIRNSFPSLGNELIVNIKDSSMLNVIGVMELFFQSSSVAGSMMLFTETFLSTCVIYLLLTSAATLLLTWIEKRLHMPKTSFPTSQSVPKAGDLA